MNKIKTIIACIASGPACGPEILASEIKELTTHVFAIIGDLTGMINGFKNKNFCNAGIAMGNFLYILIEGL